MGVSRLCNRRRISAPQTERGQHTEQPINRTPGVTRRLPRGAHPAYAPKMSDAMIRDFWSQRRMTAPLTERRALEPICTAMTSYSFKLALQNCQKALRIKAYYPIVQTLQAVLLHRTGQPLLALAQVQEIAKDVKGNGKALRDPELLMFCSYVFEENDKVASAESLWKEAVRIHPDDIPLAAEACYYYIRIGSFQALEETCLHLINEKQLEKQNPDFFQ